VEFHVHTYASLLVVRVMLSHNLIGKSDHLVMYVSKLINKTLKNYNTIEKKALIMVLLCTSSNIIC
jgi:hypothetical protein